MLQIYDPYYRQIENMLSEDTKDKLLELALDPDAFMDISYKISFFKFPSKLQKFNTTGINFACQMLRVSESGSTIHKDNNRHNEFDGTYIPRQTVISFSLTENCGVTHFYDEDQKLVCKADYIGLGAILNTGDHYHNVYFTEDNNTRYVFQLCFEEQYKEVCTIYNKYLKELTL